ncbi:MAG: aldehyde-activating protein [Alphaproteobacteria bacterium PA4]|nr:MAG: aldehyde-activating protein [Alphaproteobacteria bacterium PA4]
MVAQGQCNCGAVAFEISTAISDVHVCHCSICRRYTGSNGIAVVVVGNNAFRWLRGESDIARWQKPDADWEASFCRVCGSALPGQNDAARMFIPAGLISQGGEGLKVAQHIWVGSKAGWDVIGDDGQQHQETPAR